MVAMQVLLAASVRAIASPSQPPFPGSGTLRAAGHGRPGWVGGRTPPGAGGELDVPPGTEEGSLARGLGGRDGLVRLATFTRPELINVVSLARCVWPGHAYAERGQPGDKPAANGARKRGRKRPDLE